MTPHRRAAARLLTALVLSLAGIATMGGASAQATTPTAPPFGMATIELTPGGLHARGWAIDPDTKTAPVRVAVYSDGALVARAVAGNKRLDVARTYPAAGAAHGFDVTYQRPAGRHTICVRALNTGLGASKNLGCTTLTFGVDPRGVLNTLVQVPYGIRLHGWALDPDVTRPIIVDVHADGGRIAYLTANRTRLDVARTYPAYGSAHGFDATVRLAQGTHRICVYANNAGAGHPYATLTCRNITLNFAPSGALETATRSATASTITVAGWAADPDTSQPIRVQVSLDGRAVTTVTANAARPDIARTHNITAQHGYRATIHADDGEHRVCVRALNVLAGTTSPIIGCRIVIARHPVAPAAPRVTARAGYGSAAVTWTPGADGGAPPTTFTVRSSAGSSPIVVGATVRRAVVTGLASGRTYTFTVTATNVAGTSAAGRSNTVTTPTGPPPQTTPAPISTSHYPRNLDGSSRDAAKLRAQGASDAAHNPSGHRYLILLDVGGQGSWGGRSGVVLSATTRFVSNSALVTALNAYVDGYASRQRPVAPVVIAVGTNNDMTVSAATGVAWARDVVNPVAAHAARYHDMSVAGANDIEPGFSGNATQSRAWLTGYLRGTTRPFVFNGSADGCNWSRTGGHCNNGWSARDLYWLSGGASPRRVVGLPQIYNHTMAQQWKYISLTGVVGNQRKINFGGPLTEWTACQQAGSCGSLTGSSAWRTLWGALRTDARVAQGSLPYSTDLRIN